MRYLVDSDWLVDALIGIPAAVDLLDRLSAEGTGVSIVSYGELFEGAVGAPDPGESFIRHRAFLDRFAALPLSNPIMKRFARTRALLRASGLLISDLDRLIGATAVHHGLTHVSRNRRHFERIPDLKLYQPG